MHTFSSLLFPQQNKMMMEKISAKQHNPLNIDWHTFMPLFFSVSIHTYVPPLSTLIFIDLRYEHTHTPTYTHRNVLIISFSHFHSLNIFLPKHRIKQLWLCQHNYCGFFCVFATRVYFAQVYVELYDTRSIEKKKMSKGHQDLIHFLIKITRKKGKDWIFIHLLAVVVHPLKYPTTPLEHKIDVDRIQWNAKLSREEARQSKWNSIENGLEESTLMFLLLFFHMNNLIQKNIKWFSFHYLWICLVWCAIFSFTYY